MPGGGSPPRRSWEEEIYLAVPANSPLAERESVDLRQLREEGYIRLGNGWQLRQICDNFFHQAGVRPQMIFESNSPESVRNLIAAGLGIGFWPGAVLGRAARPTGEADPHPLSRLPPGRGGDHVQAGTGEAGSGRVCGLSVRVF